MTLAKRVELSWPAGDRGSTFTNHSGKMLRADVRHNYHTALRRRCGACLNPWSHRRIVSALVAQSREP